MSEKLLPYMALLLTWALVHTVLVIFRDIPVFDSGLIGPDSYMRMVRVTELYRDWNWFDGTIARANAPYGDTLHWTRPFDLLLMMIALPVSLLTSYEQALYVAGIVVSPLLQLATAVALIWTLRPLIRAEVWFLPVVALFLQPGALTYSVLGRADHHALLLLVFVVVAGFTLRALHNRMDTPAALFAGIATGFGLWLSVEFLLVLAICLGALGLPWLSGEQERARQSKWFAIALSIVLLIALLAEVPFDRLLQPSYDSVSCVHLLLAICLVLFWGTAETYDRLRGPASGLAGRAAVAVIGVGTLGLLMSATFPAFFVGPMAEVDPRIRPVWLDRVVEMQPLLPEDRRSLGRFVYYLGGGLLTVPFLITLLFKERSSDGFWPMFFVALASLLLWAAAVRHARFSGYAEVAFLICFAVALDRFLRWSKQFDNDFSRGLLRGGFFVAIVLGPIFFGSGLMAEDADAKDASGQSRKGCNVAELAAYLESDPRWSVRPQTVLTFMDIGPELLYRTRHSVIGTPYHRNGSGIYDGYRILTGEDENLARELLIERRVDLVLLCKMPAERGFHADRQGKENLYGKLDRGDPPSWLSPVELPPALQNQARLYRVVR